MNDVYSTICGVLLLVSVPSLLVVRFVCAKCMPWWAVVLGAAVMGWLCVNLALYFDQAHTADLVERAGGFDQAPPELIQEWANDGGPKTFAFLFGWVGGLVVLVPGIALYGIAHLFRMRGKAERHIAA
jgi:hypothetical protein